ncbi:MAG: hypothetical protein ACRC4T_20505 [Cetobacterium sp.]
MKNINKEYDEIIKKYGVFEEKAISEEELKEELNSEGNDKQ